MLLSLRIENFALIDRLELEFGSGLNVLTGETGAGKSIILDALDAALGGKVSGRAIRTGCDRALLEATFTADDRAMAWLTEHQIPIGKTIVCLRELTASTRGCRSKYRINSANVTHKQMQSWREQALEITAQGQTVLLGQSNPQRELLDLYGGAKTLAQRQVVSEVFTRCQQAKQALQQRIQSEQQRVQQLDFFTYQWEELKAAQLTEADELDRLEQEAQRLTHVVDLQEHSYQVYEALYQNDGGKAAADLLGRAETLLGDMVRFDEQLQPLLELISGALVQVMEAGQQVNAYGAALEADPQRLADVDDRIRQLKAICRKYGPTLADAIARYRELQVLLGDLDSAGQSLEALEQAYRERQAELAAVCSQLTQLRQQTAGVLAGNLIEALQPLAMEKVQFQVEITPIEPGNTGADRITFLFSSNPGEPLQSLSETASGGEMSRFLLGLKTCFSQVDDVGTLVFDEIDVGVSGRVAQAIAESLYQLAARHQVLCVTHQPLIAAMANRHFRVDKLAIDEPIGGDDTEKTEERTVIRVIVLDRNQRREELAQLAGGQFAQEAIAFADSLLAQAAHLQEKRLN